MRGKGIDAAALSINRPVLVERKRGFTDIVPGRLQDGLLGDGVDSMHGQARFTGPNTLVIGDPSYVASHVLIAREPPSKPFGFPGRQHVIDSADFMELPGLPPRILFVGGGFISFEFAHIAACAGSTPVILDRGPRPLKWVDPDLVELLISRGGGASVLRPSRERRIAVGESVAGGSVVGAGAGGCEGTS
ncbi:FAD-dependent oxidoreductase [Propioniciclava sinopodophylli]|uniref:FAD-dependent oxidoreductase n=1 Tax=Propioniciclava sinopodophylli TaxID=1837344 RepID=UPI002493BD77|nr:FAD-dependent oxidoreductase [Propioniciclava sinopodophylli]